MDDNEGDGIDTNATEESSSSSSRRRTGKILGLISPDYLHENVSVAAKWSALLAVRDFNNRSFPNSHPGGLVSDDCEFELSLSFYDYVPYAPLVRFWQEHVLLGDKDQYLAMLGALRSSESELLSTIGAVCNVDEPLDENNNTNSTAGGLLNISPLSTATDLDHRETNPYFARTIPSNAGDAEALCRYLTLIGVRHLAFVYHIGDYGESFHDAMVEAAQRHNTTLYPFSFFDLASFERAVHKLKAAPLRFVFCVVDLGEWAVVLNYFHDQGILGETVPGDNTTEYVWFFSDSLAVELHQFTDMGMWLNRTAVVSLQAAQESLLWQQQQFNEISKDPAFIQQWELSHPWANANFPSSWIPKPSLFSLLTYDAVLALGLAACKVDDSRMNVTSFELYKALAGLKFSGTTGDVVFDSVTASRHPKQMTYLIQNILFYDEADPVFSLVPVAAVRTGTTEVTMLEPMIYPSGSTTAPPETTPALIIAEDVPPGLRIVLFTITAMALLFSLFCAVWTIRQRKKPRVRVAQPIFLVVICFGSFLVAFTSILLMLKPPIPQDALSAICMAIPWFSWIGYTTIFAALFSKTWRINRLYRNARAFRRVTVLPQDVLWPLLVLLSVCIAILTVWTVMAPLYWGQVILDFDSYGRVVEVSYTCLPPDTSDNHNVALICECLLFGVSICALVLLNVESYRARNLPSAYNERSQIAMTNLILLEAFVITFPLIFVKMTWTAETVLISIVNLVICMGALLPTFVPKFTKQERERRVSCGAPNSGFSQYGSGSGERVA